jgi:hypothetical protein
VTQLLDRPAELLGDLTLAAKLKLCGAGLEG